uniref:Phosphoethanolamine N-methyltransferase 3 n=1 Tax=Talaromyces marneffei PM1 TaxID=1077442 RepID=A0A093V652_TALMA
MNIVTQMWARLRSTALCKKSSSFTADEIDRLELQQQVFNLVFDNRLIFPPIHNPRRVLDCGYGAGNWALEVAERYPHCQPLDIPDNLWLQVDNLNRPFTFPSRHFDLVHSRLVASGLDRSRWSSYVRDLVRVTKRGGWVQMAEIYFNVQSDNGSITDRHALREWSRRYMRALEDLKDLRAAPRLASLMTAAGLEDVDMRMIQLPLSAWSSGKISVQYWMRLVAHAELTLRRPAITPDRRLEQI